MQYVVAYVATVVAFLIIDLIWLGFVAKGFYWSQMDGLMRESFKGWAAGMFYLMYVAGVVYLVIAPNLASGSWREVAIAGAVLGMVAYGTYDWTNYAVLKDWPLPVTLVDWVWGTVLTATTSVIGFLAARVVMSQ